MALLSQALHLGYLLSPHSAFQGHAAHTARWPAMLSPNGSSDTCISDGVFHMPMPCFHGAIPVYPKVVITSSITLHGAPVGRYTLLVHHPGISQPSTASWRLASSSQCLSGACCSPHRVAYGA